MSRPGRVSAASATNLPPTTNGGDGVTGGAISSSAGNGSS
eukprot:CAMPEP_0172825828 /NCGR_PEP_ID=MMETSP1075-20121228/18968_1 /TAXON_ID=2916 /ORGANISM="Ceratium fusus, Strain PA161109" /LENGTH=39 /DNA_ID= /DNA_START= /DNA_END= /DNA_ORIENTATION=